MTTQDILAAEPKPLQTLLEEKSEDEKRQDEEAKAVALEALYRKLITEKKILVHENLDGTKKYLISRFTLDKSEAIEVAERFDMIHHLDRVKQQVFINGMIDGIETLMEMVRAEAGDTSFRWMMVVNAEKRLLALLAKDRTKI